MAQATILPAIRSHVGDWTFYVTTLPFDDVTRLIKDPDEIHERKKLSDWIQREAIEAHADAIAKYIQENEQRFLGSLIIGVYDGQPDWAPLRVKYAFNALEATEEQQKMIEGKLGLLRLSGEEKLFAIDGQHRVAGIKTALSNLPSSSNLRNEEVSAIFVAHDASTVNGRQRTRRLFTTVNKKAKRVSTAANIALDEDNGFAVVTRQLIDDHWLFEDRRKLISYTSTGSISPSDEYAITSVVGLYEIVRDLYPVKGKSLFEKQRPSDKDMDEHLKICVKFLNALIDNVPEYAEVFVKEKHVAGYYRVARHNHLLFRPIGQRAFARSVQVLSGRGYSVEAAVDVLLEVDMYLKNKNWHHILWDPVGNTMITTKLLLAETQLLVLAGQAARNKQSKKKLDQLLASRAEGESR